MDQSQVPVGIQILHCFAGLVQLTHVPVQVWRVDTNDKYTTKQKWDPGSPGSHSKTKVNIQNLQDPTKKHKFSIQDPHDLRTEKIKRSKVHVIFKQPCFMPRGVLSLNVDSGKTWYATEILSIASDCPLAQAIMCYVMVYSVMEWLEPNENFIGRKGLWRYGDVFVMQMEDSQDPVISSSSKIRDPQGPATSFCLRSKIPSILW